jgi:hypothetical protein
MARRIEPPDLPSAAEAQGQEERWLDRFLLAHDPNTPAGRVSAAVRAANGLPAKWAVVEAHGLTDSAVRHLAASRREHQRNKELSR